MKITSNHPTPTFNGKLEIKNKQNQQDKTIFRRTTSPQEDLKVINLMSLLNNHQGLSTPKVKIQPAKDRCSGEDVAQFIINSADGSKTKVCLNKAGDGIVISEKGMLDTTTVYRIDKKNSSKDVVSQALTVFKQIASSINLY
jgi:hypothetical protein